MEPLLQYSKDVNHFLMPHSRQDIEERFLAENPLRSSLQQLKPLEDFIRSLLPSQTVTTSNYQMARFQGNIL